MKDIRWFDMKGKELIVRKFYGVVESETETTVTFKYNKKMITLNKEECIIYG
jgi:hypothetical protein